MARTVTLTVNGKPETIDLDAILVINDLPAERATVSADIAWWGKVAGAAEQAHQNRDAEYRNWRGKSVASALSSDEKMAEWKVKAMVEGAPEFLQHKQRISKAGADAVAASAIFDAYCHKSELMRRMTSGERNERYHANGIGREESDEVPGKVKATDGRGARAAAAIKETKAREAGTPE